MHINYTIYNVKITHGDYQNKSYITVYNFYFIGL
jgi:hypothetical protein